MITKMKRLRVMAMSAQKEELLKGLLHLGKSGFPTRNGRRFSGAVTPT